MCDRGTDERNPILKPSDHARIFSNRTQGLEIFSNGTTHLRIDLGSPRRDLPRDLAEESFLEMPAPYRSYGSYKMIPNVQQLSVDSLSANFTSGDLTRWLKSYHFEVHIPINVVPIPLNVVQHGIDDG